MTEPGSDATEGSPGAESSTEADGESTDGDPASRTDRRTGDSSTTSVEQSGPDLEEIRAAVEARYDFEDFGPADMDQMTPEEWEAVFDPDSWITGPELLDRVEADLKDRVRRRNLFARVEREDREGEDTVLAYTDTGYVIVRSDGSVMGEGSILREVEPVVAMCAMEDYEPPPMPSSDEALLPHPDEVTSGSSELGNRIMLVVAGIQILAGLLLLFAPLIFDPVIRSLCSPAPGTRGFLCQVGPMDATLIPPGRSIVLTTVVGLGFIAFGGLLFLLVANARLSDRFRAEEYRDRLRAIGVGTDDRPPFVPARGELPSTVTESAKSQQRSDRADQGSDSGEITDRSRSDHPADPPD